MRVRALAFISSVTALVLGSAVLAAASEAPSTTVPDTSLSVRQALERLPYYGVFDFLVFDVSQGAVMLEGYAYQPTLASRAAAAVERAGGGAHVLNRIVPLPASTVDEWIRWSTFDRIYGDDVLSRYAPGGSDCARYLSSAFPRFPGMQPSGRYAIHIIVRNGQTTLIGVVDSAEDRQLAGIRAMEVIGSFAVTNELIVRPE